MESFGKTATDVYFPKKLRKRCPFLNNVMIECKKRHTMNIHALFAEASNKYVKKEGQALVLASKLTRHGSLNIAIKKAKKAVKKRYRDKGPVWKRLKKAKKLKSWKRKRKFALRRAERKVREKYSIRPLVTVDLEFFKDLWNSWIEYKLQLKEEKK
jgi:hypothetical protein